MRSPWFLGSPAMEGVEKPTKSPPSGLAFPSALRQTRVCGESEKHHSLQICIPGAPRDVAWGGGVLAGLCDRKL